MSIKLFTLKDVPDDEAEEIRTLLEENNIDYYETPASKWGISGATIWLKDEKQLEKAKLLITDYQIKRAHKAREAHEKLKREGKNETLIDKVKQEPIRMIFYLASIIAIIYLSIKPFIEFGQ